MFMIFLIPVGIGACSLFFSPERSADQYQALALSIWSTGPLIEESVSLNSIHRMNQDLVFPLPKMDVR